MFANPFWVQLLVLGMIIADPDLLKDVDPDDFCDEQLKQLIITLQGAGTPADKRKLLAETLDPSKQEVMPSMHASIGDQIIQRLKIDGQFGKMLLALNAVAQADLNTAALKLDALKAVKSAVGKE